MKLVLLIAVFFCVVSCGPKNEAILEASEVEVVTLSDDQFVQLIENTSDDELSTALDSFYTPTLGPFSPPKRKPGKICGRTICGREGCPSDQAKHKRWDDRGFYCVVSEPCVPMRICEPPDPR